MICSRWPAAERIKNNLIREGGMNCGYHSSKLERL
jgi:hypothetical protein